MDMSDEAYLRRHAPYEKAEKRQRARDRSRDAVEARKLLERADTVLRFDVSAFLADGMSLADAYRVQQNVHLNINDVLPSLELD